MKVVQQGVVFDPTCSDPQERCCTSTSLIRLSDSRLLCSFKCGPKKLSPTDRVVIMQSHDEGRTWDRLFSDFDTTFKGIPGSFSGGYLYERKDGCLLISLHWVDRTDPSLPLSNPQTSGVLPMKYLIGLSNDGGRSWNPLREVSLAPHPGANPTSEIVALRDGRLMMPYESWKEWDAVDGDQSANVKFSTDQGLTWSPPSTMASDPQAKLYYWDNHVTTHPGSGRPVAGFWAHGASMGRDTSIHISWSSADGQTWHTPQPTGIQGQVNSPLFLDEDRLLLVYVHRHDPGSIRAVLSLDQGQTWGEDTCVIYTSATTGQAGMGQSRSEADYWNDMARWTFGHPKAILLADGQIFVTFYAPPTGVKVVDDSPPLAIHWARISV